MALSGIQSSPGLEFDMQIDGGLHVRYGVRLVIVVVTLFLGYGSKVQVSERPFLLQGEAERPPMTILAGLRRLDTQVAARQDLLNLLRNLRQSATLSVALDWLALFAFELVARASCAPSPCCM